MLNVVQVWLQLPSMAKTLLMLPPLVLDLPVHAVSRLLNTLLLPVHGPNDDHTLRVSPIVCNYDVADWVVTVDEHILYGTYSVIVIETDSAKALWITTFIIGGLV